MILKNFEQKSLIFCHQNSITNQKHYFLTMNDIFLSTQFHQNF